METYIQSSYCLKLDQYLVYEMANGVHSMVLIAAKHGMFIGSWNN